MVDKKDVTIISFVIILIGSMGLNVTDLLNQGNWYTCEVENSLKQCDSLRSWGIPDAKCVLMDGSSDICTAGGIKYPWIPLNNSVNISIKKDVIVKSIQKCHIEYYNETIINETCLNETKINGSSFMNCILTEITIKNNKTICNPLGYMITLNNDKNYNITGECCGYFNDTQEIVCKGKVNGICNPVCQQTSIDPDEYDEYCMIYDLSNPDKITSKMVGEYNYVLDNQIKIAELKEELQ